MVTGLLLPDAGLRDRSGVIALLGRGQLRSLVWVVAVVAAGQALGRALSVLGVDGYLVLTYATIAAAGVLVLGAWPRPLQILAESRWLALLLVWAGLSTSWSNDPLDTLKQFVAVGSLLLCGIAVVDSRGRDRDVAALTSIVLTVLAAISLLLIVLNLDSGTVVALESEDGSRTWRVGLFGWNSALGMAGALGGVLAVGHWLEVGLQSRLRSRATAIWAAVLVTNVVVVVISRSATSLLAMAAGLATIAVVRWRWARVLGLAVGVLVVIGVALGRGGEWLSRVLSPLGRDPDLTGRLPIWELMLGVTDHQRLGGLGFGQSPDLTEALGATVAHSHNGYLQMLLELGWPGPLLLGLLLIQLTVRLVALRSWPWLGVLGLLLVANLANHYAMSRSVATLMLGLLVAAAAPLLGPGPEEDARKG